MSVVIDYLTIALPVFGATVLTLGSCMCCAWRRIDRRLSHFEEILTAERQPIRFQTPQQGYYPPTYPSAPPYPSAPSPFGHPAFYTPNNLNSTQ